MYHNLKPKQHLKTYCKKFAFKGRKMNRLEITMQYITAKTKIKRPSKYRQAVRLHHKILEQNDKKIKQYYSKKSVTM